VQGFSLEVKHDRKATSNNLYHLADSIRMPDFDFRQRDWYLSLLAAMHPHCILARMPVLLVLQRMFHAAR
jgi:hypothetical protein